MEVKREPRKELPENDTMFRPGKKLGRNSSVIKPEDDKDEAAIRIQKKRSFYREKELRSGDQSIRKTKSLSPQFFVNMDELCNNVTGSFDEKGLGFSFPSDNISDALRQQIPIQGKKLVL